MSQTPYSLPALTRPSGAFAMLAVDQREALRNMFTAAGTPAPVADDVLTQFKLKAAKILSPFASAVLLDRQFCLNQAVEQKVVSPKCALIAAADEFIPGNGIPVDDVQIDLSVDPASVRKMGAKAMKLLVLWREDEPAEQRLAMVSEFVTRCQSAGLVSIIEPVVRAPRRGLSFDREAAIVKAAQELGQTKADLYKAEMPLSGVGTHGELVKACARLSDKISMPWVILSSGVAGDLFFDAVRAAMEGGASGFLAGRAVWSSVIGVRNLENRLMDVAAPRLQRLAQIVDESMAARK